MNEIGEEIYDSKLVAKRYLPTVYFICDVVSII
jgi:hypothetical protein